MKTPKAIVLRTAGTNCDYESVQACRMAGFETDLIHVNKFIREEAKFDSYHLLFFPGGFAYGDYLGSAKILANKLTFRLNDLVPEFIKSGKLVIGICNGFQVLVKAGLLPGFKGNYKEQLATLSFNDSGHLQCEWTRMLNVNKGKCIFTKGIEKMHAPIAHGEGKFIPKDNSLLKKLYEQDQVVFKYEKNPTGTIDGITGICDETGRVFGMMPHPERNLFSLNDPRSYRMKLPEEGEGLKIFNNAFKYARENLI